MLKRRVGSISIRGVTTPEELETIQEEDEEDCEQDGLVVKVENDDSQFEGFYESGVPHGYFRILNSFGDLEFFGCFFRGLMLGIIKNHSIGLSTSASAKSSNLKHHSQ